MSIDTVVNREMKLKRGDIISVKGDGWTDWAIKKFTNSPYSHSALYITEGLLIESTWGGVRLNHISSYPQYDVHWHTKATPEQLDEATKWAISQKGKGYDYMGVLGIGLNSLGGNNKRNKLDDKNRYWCSELIADAFHNVGIDLGFSKDTHLVSPHGLAHAKDMQKLYDYER